MRKLDHSTIFIFIAATYTPFSVLALRGAWRVSILATVWGVAAVGVALKLNDGTGPYAFNCGAPAFRFTEDRLRNDIGPRLVAMVRNIEAALGGAMPQSKKDDNKKLKAGGKVARVVEGIR